MDAPVAKLHDALAIQFPSNSRLNRPLIVRYGSFLWDLLHGDLGISYRNKIPVWPQIIDKFPNTVILAIAGIIVALVIGIPVGIISAKKQYSKIDSVSMVASLIGVSMPNFWLGLLLSLLFALKLDWLPSQGMGKGFIPLIKSVILPALTLGTGVAATVARMGYFGWFTSTKDGDYTFYSLEHSSQQGPAGNRSFMNDPRVDALVEKGRQTTDEKTRLEAYAEHAEVLKDESNNVTIMYDTMRVGTTNKVRGFMLDPIGYHKIQKVQITK